MTALLETRKVKNSFSNTLGIPAPDDPTSLWINALDLSRSEKDTLPRSLHEGMPKTERNLHATCGYKPQSNSAQRNIRSSKAYISRDDVSPERARHLERNRVAANKCRFKKKQEHQQLQSILDGECAKRETLLAEVNVLKEEIWHIKNQVFEHATTCDSQQISLQLAMITQNKVLGANSDAVQCPSPTFSASTLSDGWAGNGDSSGIESGALENVADPAQEDFSDSLFDSFVDVPKHLARYIGK